MQTQLFRATIRARAGRLGDDLDLESLHLTSVLPRVHRDPFDRLLVAQSQTHQLTLVSPDKFFRDYGIDVIW